MTGVYPVLSDGLFCSDGFSPVCAALVHHPLCRKSIMITPRLVQSDDYYLTLFAPDESLWQQDRKVHLFDLNHFSSRQSSTSTTAESSTKHTQRILSERTTAALAASSATEHDPKTAEKSFPKN